MANLNDYIYIKYGAVAIEGFTAQCPMTTGCLKALLRWIRPKRIMEIGFNAGHSAETFLTTLDDTHVTSFDIGHHFYLSYGKEYIESHFHGRHRLIIGNSMKSVPKFTQEHPEEKFDLILIDGGHTYEIATADIQNCKSLAHKDTIVIFDDVIHNSAWEKDYTADPTKVWRESVQNGLITELGRLDVARSGGDHRGIAWGKYNL